MTKTVSSADMDQKRGMPSKVNSLLMTAKRTRNYLHKKGHRMLLLRLPKAELLSTRRLLRIYVLDCNDADVDGMQKTAILIYFFSTIFFLS
jgi:hypothetical protein